MRMMRRTRECSGAESPLTCNMRHHESADDEKDLDAETPGQQQRVGIAARRMLEDVGDDHQARGKATQGLDGIEGLLQSAPRAPIRVGRRCADPLLRLPAIPLRAEPCPLPMVPATARAGPITRCRSFVIGPMGADGLRESVIAPWRLSAQRHWSCYCPALSDRHRPRHRHRIDRSSPQSADDVSSLRRFVIACIAVLLAGMAVIGITSCRDRNLGGLVIALALITRDRGDRTQRGFRRCFAR